MQVGDKVLLKYFEDKKIGKITEVQNNWEDGVIRYTLDSSLFAYSEEFLTRLDFKYYLKITCGCVGEVLKYFLFTVLISYALSCILAMTMILIGRLYGQ